MENTKPNDYHINGRKVIYMKHAGAARYQQCQYCAFNDQNEDLVECPKEDDDSDYVCNRDYSAIWQYADEVATPEENSVETPVGRKYDSGKPRYSLLPPYALEEVVEVLTYGSQKYEDYNWMRLENPNDRFFSAANRHMWAWQRGEKNDSENGRNHLAAAIASLMFILELELKNAKTIT